MNKPQNKHATLFAPIAICLVFGFAILALFPAVLGITTPKAQAMTYADCLKAKGSFVLEIYPPTCVAPDSKKYSMNVPPVQMPPITDRISR